MSRRPAGSIARPLSDSDFAAAFAGLETAQGILAAVSGGPDSTALMGALATWTAGRAGPQISGATVDHGLRPESRGEAEAARALSGSLGLPHVILAWARDKRDGVSQETARRARYCLLVAHARAIGATHLITAHTLDDQAETLMLRLAAGSGLSGLAGMRRETRRGDLRHVRPFLHIAKETLLATCRERGWRFIDDPSNAELRFARVRWRQTLMPLLAREGLGAARLARLAERLARADDALEQAAEITFSRVARRSEAGHELEFRRLAAEPAELALRVLKRALSDGSPEEDVPHLRLERLEDCLAALLQALGTGVALRRTLAGRVLHLDKAGMLTISPEGVRHRGSGEPVTPIRKPELPSLGRGTRRA